MRGAARKSSRGQSNARSNSNAFSSPKVFDAFYGSPVDFVTHGQRAREFSEQGIVLFKNEDNYLPLQTTNLRSIALIGPSWFAGMAIAAADTTFPASCP